MLIVRNIFLVVLYVGMHASGYGQGGIILALICYLVPFLVLQVSMQPYGVKTLNILEVMGISVLLIYMLNELVEVLRSNANRDYESTSTAIFFVILPTLIYMFFTVKFLRE